MGSIKTGREKKAYLSAMRKNRPVPAWVILKTSRKFMSNFKRRDWRHRKLKL